MKNFLLVSFLFFFSVAAVQAYSGTVSLYLMADEQELEAGETTSINIILDSADLLTDPDEAVQTISAYISFPSDFLEVVGMVDYSLSPFSTPYVNDVDNDAGFIELVRARDISEELLELEIIGTFQVRVKDGASGDLDILLAEGMNSLLLNDVTNSNVLGEVMGETLTVSDDVVLPPPADDDDDDVIPPDDGNPVADATISFSADNTTLAVGESALVSIYMNTGSDANSISATDFIFGFPEDLLEVSDSSVDISSGVFSSQTINIIDSDSGVIELVLFENPGVSSSNALVGSFVVQRIAEGDALLYMAEASALFTDDIENTDVLDVAGSSGLLITDSLPVDPPADVDNDDDDDDDDGNDGDIITPPPADDDNDGGGGGGGESRSNDNRPTAQTDNSPDEELHGSASDDPLCQAVEGFSGKRKEDGDIHLSWNRVDDPAVEGFEVVWQKDGSGKKESMAIPKTSSINFPGEKLEPGKTYSFTLVSIGTDCSAYSSDSISLSPKVETGEFLPMANEVGDMHSSASENDSSLYSASMTSTPSGYVNMKNAEVAGKSFSGVPGTPENGPVALALLLISAGIGFVIFSRRRRGMKE